MSPGSERRLLQAAVALGCLSPFWFGLKGMIEGPAMLVGVEPGRARPIWSAITAICPGCSSGSGWSSPPACPGSRRGRARLRWAAGAIVLGGLARLGGLAMGDAPSLAHHIALAAELGLTPLLVLWQARVARRCTPV